MTGTPVNFQQAMSICRFRTVCSPPGHDNDVPVREVVTIFGRVGPLHPALIERIAAAVANNRQFMICAETPEMLATAIATVDGIALALAPAAGHG